MAAAHSDSLFTRARLSYESANPFRTSVFARSAPRIIVTSSRSQPLFGSHQDYSYLAIGVLRSELFFKVPHAVFEIVGFPIIVLKSRLSSDFHFFNLRREQVSFVEEQQNGRRLETTGIVLKMVANHKQESSIRYPTKNRAQATSLNNMPLRPLDVEARIRRQRYKGS